MSQEEDPKYEIDHYVTGGTVDSEWVPEADTAKPRVQTIIPDYLREVRLPRHQVRFNALCMKDSREVGVTEQDYVAGRMAESPYRRVVGSTGTYLMDKIAEAITRHRAFQTFKRAGKRVLLTGSGTPIDGFEMSDGGFNLGMTAAVLQEDTGILVGLVMNGLVLDAEKGIRKDLREAIFSSHDGHDVLPYDEFTLVPLGGSMDFVPDGLDRLVPAKESAIPEFFRKKVKLQRKFEAVNPFVKDSRDLTDEDLELVLDTIRNATSDRVLVTLGIYQIRKLQQYLREKLDTAKTVVLTGSRLPLRGSSMTDASFNLGYSLGKIGFLQEGVHIALNGTMMDDEDNIIDLLYTPAERNRLAEMGIAS